VEFSVLTQTLPVLPLRDIVVFPQMIVPLFVGRDKSVSALEGAMAADKSIFLVSQLDPAEDDPDRDALYDLGVVATVLQLLKLPDGTVRVLVEGQRRASLAALRSEGNYLVADVSDVEQQEPEGPEVSALMRSVVEQFENYAKLNKKLPAETAVQLGQIEAGEQARRCGCSQHQHQGVGQAGAARRAEPGAPAGNDVRLHGRRARRAAGREEDPLARQAPDGEDRSANIISTSS
jgi:ATP-dependent Lon protease